jgi:hypothetical protein
MFKAFQLKSLAGASIDVKEGQTQEGILENQLVMGKFDKCLKCIKIRLIRNLLNSIQNSNGSQRSRLFYFRHIRTHTG